MSDMTLIPSGLGGGFGGEAGAAAVGGGIGGLIGSWIGNGWGGGGGWGGWGGRAGPVEVQASVDTNAILQAINNGTLQTIQGQNGTNLTVERSAASTFNGITQQNTQNLLASVQGFAGLNNQVQQALTRSPTLSVLNPMNNSVLLMKLNYELKSAAAKPTSISNVRVTKPALCC